MINIDLNIKYTRVEYKVNNKIYSLYLSGWKNKTQVKRDYPSLNILRCRLITAYTSIPIDLIIKNTMKYKESVLDYEKGVIER